MSKIDNTKLKLIRWILLFQEFDVEIKDKKGANKLEADHLSKLKNPFLDKLDEREISDFSE